MIRVLIAALFTLANVAFALRPAQAVERPWCLITSAGGEHCSYNSLDECLRDRVGGGGFCNPNPRYHGAEHRRNVPPRKKHRSH